MKRRRRFAIKLIALSFASAAIGAPTAQAMPDEMTAEELRSIHESRLAARQASRATTRTVPTRRPRRPIGVPDQGSDLDAMGLRRMLQL